MSHLAPFIEVFLGAESPEHSLGLKMTISLDNFQDTSYGTTPDATIIASPDCEEAEQYLVSPGSQQLQNSGD